MCNTAKIIPRFVRSGHDRTIFPLARGKRNASFAKVLHRHGQSKVLATTLRYVHFIWSDYLFQNNIGFFSWLQERDLVTVNNYQATLPS